MQKIGFYEKKIDFRDICTSKLKHVGLYHTYTYTIFIGFVSVQIGRPVLYLPWAICWALYHCVWVVLEAYWWSLKAHRAPLEWLLKLTNIGYVLLTAVAVMECVNAVYTYCFHTSKELGKIRTTYQFMVYLFHNFVVVLYFCKFRTIMKLYVKVYYFEYMLISLAETKTAMPWNYKLSWVLNNMSHTTALLIALSYWTMLSQRKYMYICFWCKVNQFICILLSRQLWVEVGVRIMLMLKHL